MPSLDHDVVAKFAAQLGAALGVPFVKSLRKTRATPPQKQMENSFQQLKNLLGVIEINGTVRNEPVLLIDDIVDSGWTLTLGSVLLRKAGSGPVYPFALAKSTPAIS